jgi:hypothetical protein
MPLVKVTLVNWVQGLNKIQQHQKKLYLIIQLLWKIIFLQD